MSADRNNPKNKQNRSRVNSEDSSGSRSKETYFESEYEEDYDDYEDEDDFDETEEYADAKNLLYIAEDRALGKSNSKNKKNFLEAVLPHKNDKISEAVRKVVFLVSITAALICFVFLISDLAETKKDNDFMDDIREIKQSAETSGGGTVQIEDNSNPNTGPVQRTILAKWKDLYETNNDLVGWVKIEGTRYIDYPVVQRSYYDEDGALKGDNDFYLERNFEQKPSKNGSVFADWHTPIDDSGRRPDNTVLYAHNIYTGEYFAYVAHYFPAAFGMDAILSCPTVEFETIYEEERSVYKIFAGAFFNTLEKDGEVYPYYQKRFFNNEEAFYDFVGNVMDRSTFYTDVDLEYGDEILTLSTCYYIGDNNTTRYAVFARRIRDGEDPNVDTSKTYRNESPLYFDSYMRAIGSTWKGRTWDTSKVKGFDEFYANLEEEDIID